MTKVNLKSDLSVEEGCSFSQKHCKFPFRRGGDSLRKRLGGIPVVSPRSINKGLGSHFILYHPVSSCINTFYKPTGVHLDPITKYARKQTQYHFYDISLCSNVFYYSVNKQPGTFGCIKIICLLLFPDNMRSICSIFFFQTCSVTMFNNF